MSRLSKDVLLEWIDNWRDYCRESCIEKLCVGGMGRCNQAYQQIVAMMRQRKDEKVFIPWKGRLKNLKFRGLFFTWGKPLAFIFPKWKTGWESTQMNEFLFLGYCYLSWSM